MSNQQLAEELHKPITRKFKKEKYILLSKPFKAFGGVDLGDMQLIKKYNKGIRYLLCVIYFSSKYTWVVALKGKRIYY